MLRESHRGHLVGACVIFTLLGAWLMWSSRAAWRDAKDHYDALASAAVVTYQVTGRSNVVTGQGKNRVTTWFLHFVQPYPAPGAPRQVQVKVDRGVHDRTREGEVWSARIDAGQPVFDPARTDYESGIGRRKRVAGLVLAVLGVGLLALHLSGRLYRPLF